MTPEEYFSSLIQSGTQYNEAMRITKVYFPNWDPSQPQTYGAAAPQPIGYQQVQQPLSTAHHLDKSTVYVSTPTKKTFYAPLLTTGIILVLMFTPFLTFEHEEFTNSEENEICKGLYMSFQSGVSGEFDAESDDLECPMNGYSSTIYSIETIANVDTSEITDDTSSSDPGSENDDMEDEIAMFGIALIMLFFAPIIYVILSFLALISVGLKKYPMVIGALQVLYIILFIAFSTMGVIDDGMLEVSVHGNLTGIGMYLIGFVGVGYFIPK